MIKNTIDMYSGKKEFWLALVIVSFIVKIITSFLFTSGYYHQTYVPFIETFSEFGFEAWSLSKVSFPYPPLMAIIIFPFIKLSTFVSAVIFKNFLFHLPILIAYLLVFTILRLLLPGKERGLFFFYLISPVLFFSSYIHSQLDLVPTSVFLLSILFLFRKRYLVSICILGVAIGIKWHIVVAVPFFIIFLLKKENAVKVLPAFLLVPVPLLLSLAPLDMHGIANVFNISEKNLIFDSFLEIVNLKLYLFPCIYLIVLGRTFSYSRINAELFMGEMAIIFMVFVLVVYPNPGWFVWSLPFISYSFIKNTRKRNVILYLYVLINVSYLIFFIGFYRHPLNAVENIIYLNNVIDLNISNPILQNLSFSILVSVMIISVYAIYRSAIQNSRLYKRKFEAFLIGISGDSGAGKSTLLKSLQGIFGDNLLSQLEGDGEHKWERGDSNWEKYTHLNPKANELHKQLMHLRRLKTGNKTKRADYNHHSGKFDTKKFVASKDFIVLAGLHTFYLKGARECIDFKIFIDTDENLRKHWKVLRDTQRRGYTKEQVLQQLALREKDAQKYISPQIQYSDLVIRYRTQKPVDIGVTSITLEDLILEYVIDIDVPLDELIHILEQNNCIILEHDFDENLLRQRLSLKLTDEFSAKNVADYYTEMISEFDIQNIHWQTGVNGLNQIIMMHCIEQKYLGIFNEKV